MKTFLSHIAEIITNQPFAGDEICVVLPNRRAGLFLKQQLVPSDNKPHWLPKIIPVEDFVFSVSRLTEPDSITLLATLYKAYCRVNSNPVSFDNFLNWGAEILRDFEETDQYLTDTQRLFSYIHDAREIDIWKPGEEPTEFEKNYISFFESLGPLYESFSEMLLEGNFAYQGLASRVIAENTEKYLDKLPYNKIIFAGFNALTPVQLTIIKYLVSKKRAEIIFDADSYYLDNPSMEAGYFLRKFKNDKALGTFSRISNEFLNPEKNIFTCGIPGKTGQARIAGSILNTIPPDKHQVTAVVLADETMLLPVLNALPGNLDSFNVTMGFPLAQTPLYALADSIFRLHVNALNSNNGNPSFYHADVTAVLQNPYLYNVIDRIRIQRLLTSIKKNNYSYITFREILSIASEDNTQNQEVSTNEKGRNEDLLSTLFTSITSALMLPAIVAEILESIKNAMPSADEASADHEMLFSLYTLVTRLKTCLEKEAIEIESLQTLYSFFRESVSAAKVPFYGEPLKGIQVMGMLETRVLDFENVILLSANEDILPSAKNNRSFIPFDIRVNFGLPTYHERQAVFAYHFYRLLQRCKNVWLVYNEDDNMLGGGEKSRYIQQLEWELPLKGLQLKKLTTTEKSSAPERLPISIRKDEALLTALKTRAAKRLSFTSLQQYVNCPLSFYYSYVLGLEETEEVEEDISSRTMGIILHDVLKDIYEPYVNKAIAVEALKAALEKPESLIISKTKSVYPALKIDSGKNLLFIKVAETWLKRFLESELKAAIAGNSPIIMGIEIPLIRTLKAGIGSNETDITIYGKIDRMDIDKGSLRVIDYKTGKVEDKDTRLAAVEDLFDPEKETAKQLQLTLYKFLTEGYDISNGHPILPGIISFKMLGKGFMALESQIESADFEHHLLNLLNEILNPAINFEQNDIKHCRFCNFHQICHRENNSW